MIEGGIRKFAVVALVAALATSPVLAQDALKSRLASFREIGAAFKNVNDQLRSDTPQVFVIQVSAREIRNLARSQYTWFPAGSGPAPGVKTRAKAEIWSQGAQFKAAQDAFAAQADNFARVAQGGNVEQMRAAARTLGQSCGGCHRQFRSED